MKTQRLVHMCSVALLAYCGASIVWAALKEPAVIPKVIPVVFHLCLWSFLGVMLYRRPTTWGLGIAVFLFAVIAIQLSLWRLALTKKEEFGVSDSWLKFVLSVVPLFAAAIGSLSLRWISPEEPNQPPEPTR